MSIRESQRAELESAYPEQFTDGAVYLDLARRARDLSAARFWDSAEWSAATGQQRPAREQRLWAPSIYEIYAQYETERMSARWLSGAGETLIDEYEQELNAEARSARDPLAVQSIQNAFWFLTQAKHDPDKRLPFSRAIAQLNLAAKVRPRGDFTGR